MELYEVGGAVRDSLLGIKSKDIDYSVVLEPHEIAVTKREGRPTPFQVMEYNLRRQGFEIFLSTPEYLTIRAKFPKDHKHAGLTADFVLARKESGYTDGRRPDHVEPGDLLDDLSRRDFTMNAIAKDHYGCIIDPFNGTKDIEDRTVRAVGSPDERFAEDALRILRALRFAVTKGFRLENHTARAAYSMRDTVAGVSPERVREELSRMFNADPMATLDYLHGYDLFRIVFDMGINFQPTLKERIK